MTHFGMKLLTRMRLDFSSLRKDNLKTVLKINYFMHNWS